MVNYEPEIRTDIEELYNERIVAFNNALVQRLNEKSNVLDLNLQIDKLHNLLKSSESRYLNVHQQNNLLRRKELDKSMEKNELKTLIFKKIEDLKWDKRKHEKLKRFIKKILD